MPYVYVLEFLYARQGVPVIHRFRYATVTGFGPHTCQYWRHDTGQNFLFFNVFYFILSVQERRCSDGGYIIISPSPSLPTTL